MQLVTAAVLLSLVGLCRAQATLTSPCPRVFQYEAVGGERGRWHGVISLPPNTVISSLWLNLVLDSRGQSSWSEDVSSEKVEFKIEHIKKKAGATEVRFYVNHNSRLVIPRLADIRLNDEEICKRQRPGTGTVEEGTYYWIKLVGSQETKPGVSGYSSPVTTLTSNAPTAKNDWLTYYTGLQPQQQSQRPGVLAPQLYPQASMDQNRAGEGSSNGNSKVKHINMGIFPIPGTSIEFAVHYDPNLRVSTVNGIRLNGRAICTVETIQPASKTPVLKRGIVTNEYPTQKSSWYNFIRWKDPVQTVNPGRSIYTEQTPSTENFSPLGNSAPNTDSWQSYIATNRKVPPTWQGGSNAQLPGTNKLPQSKPNSWMSYISGTGSPNPPTQRPVDEGSTTEFEVEDVEMRIFPAPETDIWFHVQYNPHGKIPKAVQIKLNGADICTVGFSSQSPSSGIDVRWGGDTDNNYQN